MKIMPLTGENVNWKTKTKRRIFDKTNTQTFKCIWNVEYYSENKISF